VKSTKYQLLKSDYDFACGQLKEYMKMIKQLRKEKEQAYYDGYKQGRFDEQMNRLNE